MDKLTDFTDTTDVSDAAIEWVLRASGGKDSVAYVRCHAKDPYMTATRSRIIAARLIQQHRPELLVDPVDAIIDEKMRDAGFISSEMRDAAKRLYQMGLQAGKGKGND
jgi:hypothetical protein